MTGQLKTIGIIGGLSPESTAKYYIGLNHEVAALTKGAHTAKILLSSVDFELFVTLKNKGDWQTQGDLLVAEAVRLEQAGADFIILATNTMHKMADQIEEAVSVPFLHLADATAQRIVQDGVDKIGLLGTRYTMELDFYKDRLRDKGIEPLVPDGGGRQIIQDIIYDELVKGVVSVQSRQASREIIAALVKKGAQGIILGCTELTMLIEQNDSAVPLFDTTRIHVEQAARFSLEN